MSPKKFGVYQVENTNQLICTNHFQSNAYAEDANNIKHKAESHSEYRYERMEELLSATGKLTVPDAVNILRNKEGLNDKSIGYGNEKALNQLLAHHGIVFKPEERQVWVSSNPYQLGAFVAYDLDDVFSDTSSKVNLSKLELTIEADDFQFTQAFKNYEAYRVLSKTLQNAISDDEHIASEKLSELIQLNYNYWEAYFLVGKYYYEKGYYRAALNSFEEANTKEITTVPDQGEINSYIKKIKRKLNL